MTIFSFNKRKIFVVIDFDNIPGLFDYPKDSPIPRIGERIIFNGKYGRVRDLTHNTTETVTEIKIQCAEL